MANNLVGGVAYLKVDGRQLALRGNLTVSIGTTERSGVAGQDGVHGYTENPRVPFMQGDITTTPGTSVEEIEAITEATITCELGNGRSYLLERAWCKSAVEINAKEGQFQVRFEGMNGAELT